MKIRVISEFYDKFHTSTLFKVGTVLDFDDERAKYVISKKLAEPYTESEEKPKEAPKTEAPKTEEKPKDEPKPEAEVKTEEAPKEEEVKADANKEKAEPKTKGKEKAE